MMHIVRPIWLKKRERITYFLLSHRSIDEKSHKKLMTDDGQGKLFFL